MSALSPELVSPTLDTRSFASTPRPTRSPRFASARFRFTSRDLSELVLANQSAGRLSFTTSLKEAARGAKAIFIAVGTPSLAEVGSADLQLRACRRARDRRSDRGFHRRGGEVDGSGRLLRRGRADHRRAGSARKIRGRLQSGIPARGRGDRGFQASRPHRRRRRRTSGRPRSCARCIIRWRASPVRWSSPRDAAPR